MLTRENWKQKPYNHPVNHVAIAVPDIDAAVKWYSEVLGFVLLAPVSGRERATDPNGGVFKIYPPDLNGVRIAWLSASNGVGVELFEFQDPKTQDNGESSFEKVYHRGGYFHICITVPDVDEFAKKVIEAGGRQIGKTVQMYEHKALYVADPWGNAIELLPCSFDQLLANRV